ETLANTWLSSLLQTLFPPLSCFSAMLFSAPRRFLALRTKIAAAPRHDHALNSRLAAKARFPLSSIRSMMPLIFSRLAFRVKKVRDRGSAHHNRPLQDALQRAVQFFHLLLPQPRSQPHRMDPGFPQALIGVDVSHAAQNPLIQQQRLDSCTLSTDSRRIAATPPATIRPQDTPSCQIAAGRCTAIRAHRPVAQPHAYVSPAVPPQAAASACRSYPGGPAVPIRAPFLPHRPSAPAAATGICRNAPRREWRVQAVPFQSAPDCR